MGDFCSRSKGTFRLGDRGENDEEETRGTRIATSRSTSVTMILRTCLCLNLLTKQCREVNSFQGYQPNIESDSYNETIFQVKVPRSDNTMNQFQGYRSNPECEFFLAKRCSNVMDIKHTCDTWKGPRSATACLDPTSCPIKQNFTRQVSALCLTADEIEAQRSGWNLNPNTQYHIQTDEGPERFFRFQTSNGQYRKEKRLADGTVIGTEGWLDPLGYLRLKDYIADHEGFRILRSKMVYVGKDRPIQDAVAETKKVPAQTGVLARPKRPPNPFRRPDPNAVVPLSGNDITSGYYTPTTIRPRPISRNNYYSSRSGYPSSGLQSLDTYHRPQATYYRGSAARPPTQILEAPYDPVIGDSSVRPSYQLPISRNDPGDFPPYDGTHTTANGFQYYLRRQYHEEGREPDGNVGSFGYIDPFGIRRVIYYKTDPFTGGFLHKKNNRYVGFNATPYDPLPPDLSRTRLSRASQTSAS